MEIQDGHVVEREHAVGRFLLAIAFLALILEPSMAADMVTTQPDASVDQTASIQAGLDEAGRSGGGEVRLPPGRHAVLGNLTVPTGVTLSGSWQAPHHGIVQTGTTLEAYAGRDSEDAPAFITLKPSSALRGLTIVYPRQIFPDVRPYPWTIRGDGMHNTVENVTLVNSYNGIAIGLEWSELHLIRNVFGCVLRRGILVDNTSDIGRIENVHFNPHYWSRSKVETVPTEVLNVGAYMQRNLEAFTFARTDWQYVSNTFVFAAKVGYRFIRTPKGACNGQFVGIGADMCQYGLVVEDMQPISLLINNGQFVSGPLPGNEQNGPFVGVDIRPEACGGVQLVNCSWWGNFDHFVRHNAPGCRLSIAHATMSHCRDVGIDLVAGMAYVEDVLFNDCHGLHLRVGPKVRKAVLRGMFNSGMEGLRIDNQAGPRTQIDSGEPASQPAGGTTTGDIAK